MKGIYEKTMLTTAQLRYWKIKISKELQHPFWEIYTTIYSPSLKLRNTVIQI